MNAMVDREQAWQIFCEFTKSENLRKHALAVEACVTAYTRKFGEDEAKWSVASVRKKMKDKAFSRSVDR